MTRVGIIGTGWGARVQVPLFREAGLTVAAIAGSNAGKTKKIAAELGVESHDSWRSLTGSDVDLVSITVPPRHHVEMAIAALEAGKHVLCEKPTALSSAEAEELVRAGSRHAGQLGLIDHELRFLPSFMAARDRVQELGGVRYIEVRYASPARGDRSRAWNWWSAAEEGGGIWGAVGSHFVDAIRYLGLEILEVQSALHTTITERPYEGTPRRVTSDDFATVHLRLSGGALATMNISAVAAGPDEAATITVHGEKCAMRLVGEELQMNQAPGKAFERVAGGPLQERPGNSPGGAFGSGTFYLGQALRAALDEGDRNALAPAATFEDGLAQQRVLDAARESSKAGGFVRVSA